MMDAVTRLFRHSPRAGRHMLEMEGYAYISALLPLISIKEDGGNERRKILHLLHRIEDVVIITSIIYSVF